jgi:acyl-CoA thioester hydrolase
MTEPFRVRIAVRGYELDTNGHLNQAVYLLYAEHSRRECVRAAGIAEEKMQAAGVGPVILETTIRFRRELRGGDEVDVSSEFLWGDGKTFRISHQITRVDGILAAELDVLAGVLDLRTRRLVPDPAGALRPLAAAPEVLCI